MSIREQMNKHPRAVVSGLGAVLALCASVILLGETRPSGVAVERAFYTDDDGKTTFVDSIDLRPPFDHNGKAAVRARVFTVDGGKSQFVGYLERYTDPARQKLAAADADRASGKVSSVSAGSPEITIKGTEVKRPGDLKWTKACDMAGRSKVVTLRAPVGGTLDAIIP